MRGRGVGFATTVGGGGAAGANGFDDARKGLDEVEDGANGLKLTAALAIPPLGTSPKMRFPSLNPTCSTSGAGSSTSIGSGSTSFSHGMLTRQARMAPLWPRHAMNGQPKVYTTRSHMDAGSGQ